MPSVGVIFEIRQAETLPGETLRVVGGAPELGAWNPSGGKARGPASAEADMLRLKTGALSYPRWSMSAPVWINFQDSSKESGSPDFSQRHVETISTMDGFDDSPTMDSLDTVSSEPSTPRAPARSHDMDLITPGCTSVLEVEYKFLMDLRQLAGDGAGRYKWEEKIENRRVLLPQEPGSIWLVSDALWNSDEPASVSRIEDADIVARCLELDPDHTVHNLAKPKFELSMPMTTAPGGASFAMEDELDLGAFNRAFTIEDEFAALSNRQLPELLAEKLAAERTASGMAAELMDLQHESAIANAAKEQIEEEAKSLRDDNTQLKEALLAMTRRLEACSRERDGEVRTLREENAELREENAQLLAELERLRLMLSNSRAALVTTEDRTQELEDRTQELEDEAKRSQEELRRLREECAELRRENEELRSAPPKPAEELFESSAESSEAMIAMESDEAFERETTELQLDEPFRRRMSAPAICEDRTSTAHKAEHRSTSKGPQSPSGETSPASAKKAKDMELLLAKVRSSLYHPQLAEKERRTEQKETELMKVLRRRRERINC